MIETSHIILGGGFLHLDIILLMGLAIIIGTTGADVFRKLHIPRVVAYIVIGVSLGPVLKFFSAETIKTLEPFNMFALGIIGFLIGGELKKAVFDRFGRQVLLILFFEGVTAFLFVVILSFVVIIFFYDWRVALSVSVVLGAICSATDPASSTNVLWEYKSRGPLTTMLTAIVALDDVLALILYITSISIAGFLTGHQQAGPVRMLFYIFYEIAGSLGLGFLAGLLLRWIITGTEDSERLLVFAVGVIVLGIGLAKQIGMDVILLTMACGVTLTNVAPKRSVKCFELIHRFSPPVYVLFFVVIGARLSISAVNLLVVLMIVAYILGSTFGKTIGSYLGARYSRSVPAIRKYLGFCLYQQGTIAVALLIMASQRFEAQLSHLLLSVVVVGVFVLQLFGPVFVKTGIKKAGEAGLNITEEDLIKTYKVADVMETAATTIPAGMSLREVIGVVSGTEDFYYSVVDSDNKLIGAITLDGIRKTFATQQLNDWLVALDIAESVVAKITPELALAEGFEKARQFHVEYLPVVVSADDDKHIGVLNCNAVRRRLSAEVLARQQKADSIPGIPDVKRDE
jgi:Kef-type K+ transport system membrane component KefB